MEQEGKVLFEMFNFVKILAIKRVQLVVYQQNRHFT